MFDNIFAAIEKWMRELLSGMVESNLSTMFTAVNQQTSEIAAQVGQTPQGWNSSIFSMIRNISDSVVIPIAGIIITLILCYELISMLTERNNLHDVDTWMFFKYFVKMKSDFILSLCELIMGARDGMEPEEKSVIDRCLPLVYQKYLNDPKPENMPTLGDLYDCLREQKERQAQRIATALEIYVNGSLRVFNHQTNVELDNRIICFDIKELGKQLKKLGMLIVQDQVWNRVTVNRNSKKNTRYYIDEFHLLLKEEQTAAYSVEIWKRFRKWGGVPTGITQNIKDLLASREIENIFENSDFIYMLNQASGDRQILAKQLNISPFQLSYVTNSNEGEGLLFYGNTIIPFKDKFDTSLKLYSLMTTKPNEMGKYKEKKEA